MLKSSRKADECKPCLSVLLGVHGVQGIRAENHHTAAGEPYCYLAPVGMVGTRSSLGAEIPHHYHASTGHVPDGGAHIQINSNN